MKFSQKMVFLVKISPKNGLANKIILENLDFFQRIQFGTPKCESQTLNKNSQNNLRRTPLSYPFRTPFIAKILQKLGFLVSFLLQEFCKKNTANIRKMRNLQTVAKNPQKVEFCRKKTFYKFLQNVEFCKCFAKNYIHITKIFLFFAC